MSSDTNDPYMTVTPGIHHYSDYYKIIVPGNYRNNIIPVIIPIDYFDKIKTSDLPVSKFTIVFQNLQRSLEKTPRTKKYYRINIV